MDTPQSVTLIGDELYYPIVRDSNNAHGTIVEADEDGNLHLILLTGDKMELR